MSSGIGLHGIGRISESTLDHFLMCSGRVLYESPVRAQGMNGLSGLKRLDGVDGWNGWKGLDGSNGLHGLIRLNGLSELDGLI